MATAPSEDNTVTNGFIIKDKNGSYKKVEDGRVVDYTPVVKKQPPQSSPDVPQAKEAPQRNAPPAAPPHSLKPQSPVSGSAKAAFYMDPEDEEEILQHSQALANMMAEKKSAKADDYNNQIASILAKSDLHFDSEIMNKRFFKVAESRLKDIRDSLETKEVLKRPSKIGGLELSEEQAATVTAMLDSLRSKVSGEEFPSKEKPSRFMKPQALEQEAEHQQQKTMYASAPPSYVPRPGQQKESVDDRQHIPPKPTEPPQQPTAQPSPAKEPTGMPKKESSLPKQEIAYAVTPEPKEPAPAPTQPVEGTEQISAEETRQLYKQSERAMPRRVSIDRQAQRPQVTDVKQPIQPMGPVEELGDIDLQEFRRMGNSPSETAEKILEKIDLLEEDSWDVKMKGIQSWKQSPVYKLYLDIGRQSMEDNLPVAEVIRKRQSEKQPTILMEEFSSVNSLNNSLGI